MYRVSSSGLIYTSLYREDEQTKVYLVYADDGSTPPMLPFLWLLDGV